MPHQNLRLDNDNQDSYLRVILQAKRTLHIIRHCINNYEQLVKEVTDMSMVVAIMKMVVAIMNMVVAIMKMVVAIMNMVVAIMKMVVAIKNFIVFCEVHTLNNSCHEISKLQVVGEERKGKGEVYRRVKSRASSLKLFRFVKTRRRKDNSF